MGTDSRYPKVQWFAGFDEAELEATRGRGREVGRKREEETVAPRAVTRSGQIGWAGGQVREREREGERGEPLKVS